MMRATSSAARRAAGVLLLSALGVLSGCGDRDVVAEVGKTKVTRGELQAFMAGSGGALGKDPAAALEAIAGRALLAEAARRADVDEEPAVAVRLAASRREILASAYLEKELAKATREDLLRARYQAEKEKLARRRIHVAHIVIRPARQSPEARAEAQSRMVKVYAQLAAGKPFEEVARESSEDRLTAARGGDLGEILEGQTDPSFFEKAAALREGETSRPFESGYGFHVVKAIEAPGVVTPTFEEARGRLEAEARREAEAKLVDTLRGDIGVELHPDRIQGPGRRPDGAGEGK
jgi:parvulin-like peptidyl-prolyl isomerase